MKHIWCAALLAALAACGGGKGPMYVREPQVKTCACRDCVCPHCVKHVGAVCYCGDRNDKGEAMCDCNHKQKKTCTCDVCRGYPMAPKHDCKKD